MDINPESVIILDAFQFGVTEKDNWKWTSNRYIYNKYNLIIIIKNQNVYITQ